MFVVFRGRCFWPRDENDPRITRTDTNKKFTPANVSNDKWKMKMKLIPCLLPSSFLLPRELSPSDGVYLSTPFGTELNMRKVFLVAVVLVASATPTLPQTADKTTTDRNGGIEQTVVKLTHEWIAADESADRASLSRIISEDFMGTGPTGLIVFKEDVIPMEGSPRGGLSITPQEVKARVFGDSAVVTGRGVRKSREQDDLRFTLVFAKRQNRWQMVAGHLSPVASQ